MNNEEQKDRIIELLGKGKKRPLTAAEIAAKLKLPSKSGKRLQKTLNRLVASGNIIRIRNNRYSLGKSADLVAGKLSVIRSGNGFVQPADAGDEVFVKSRDMGTALPNDRVLVRLSSKMSARGRDTGKQNGKIIRIIERSRNDIVGTLRSTGRFLSVVPIDPIYSHSFYVPKKGGAELDDRVVIRFTEWKNKHVSPEAEVVEVLGPADNPSGDTNAVIRHSNLRVDFPDEVVSEAGAVSSRMTDSGSRKDLRNSYILTIDPEKSRDFDDALSLTKDNAGNRVLGVHIADVSHFVEKGSALDKEALLRGNSVYLPDKVIPMLPEQLSNGICSLKPNEDRLAFSVMLTIDSNGKVISSSFAKTKIRSKLRLTYQQVLPVIKKNGEKKESAKKPDIDKKAVTLLRDLHRLAQQFRRQRFARHALNLDVPESEIVLDEKGIMTGIRLVENDISHQLVEECMVAANEAVAFELKKRQVSLISRYHEKPKPEKIEELTDFLVNMGYQPGNLIQRRVLAGFLKKIDADPLAHHIQVAVLKSMNRAFYSANESGHYGLAKSSYAHFTSPIRRYPDLAVHRQLAAMLTGTKKNVYSKKQLAGIAITCSETEDVATLAERSIIEIKKYRYLAAELEQGEQEVYDAVVVTVLNFGMFVELVDLQIQGLVHASTMSDKFASFNQKKQTLKAGSKIYSVGMKLRVYVTDVDFDSRRIDFRLAVP